MPGFFNKSFEEQVKIAIDCSDPKLLQMLLGPKNCQLWEYWLIHSIFSHNILAVIKVAEHQLPIDILNSQRSTLEGKFWQVNVETGDNVMCTTPTEKMAEVNKALEENKNKVLERYKSCMNSSNISKTEMVSIPLFYDVSRGVSYSMFSSLDECSERAKDVKKVVERFKNNPVILQALTLNFSPQYNEICQGISQEYQLKVTETDKIADLVNELRNKYLLIADNDERIELVLDQLRENIINKIRDEEFMDEMYERLLDNVLNAARNNRSHVFHQDIINTSMENVKDKIKKNSNVNSDNIKLLDHFLEYVAAKTKPDLNIINILLINGASLHVSQVGCTDKKGQQVSKSVGQYFLESSNSDLMFFPDKSIFTIMKEAHKVLFDFPIMKGEMNLAEVLSAVPSKFAEFKGDEKNKPIFTKVGEKGEKKLMELLNDYKKLVEEKESGRDTRNIAEKLWSKFCSIFSKSATASVKEDYTSVYKKLDECIEVGYLAVATGDDKVIIDYARVVKKEQEDERDEDVKKLCDILLTILFEHQDLVKLSWKEVIPYKFKRFVKWNPAWEKILTAPELKNIKYNIPELNDIIPGLKNTNYDTRASEWSHNNHTIVEGRKERRRLIQGEENAELKVKIDEERTRADRLELDRRIRRAFTMEICRLDDELRYVVADSQDQIVGAILNYAIENRQQNPEPIVSAVMGEIRLSREQVIRENIVNAGLINAGIRSFLTNVSVEPGCSAGMSRS